MCRKAIKVVLRVEREFDEAGYDLPPLGGPDGLFLVSLPPQEELRSFLVHVR